MDIDDTILEYFADAKGYSDIIGEETKNPQSRVEFAVECITKEAKLFVASKEARTAHDTKLEEVLSDPNIFTKEINK